MNARLAGPADADAIAALMRDSFDPATLGLTIYGCSGVARYLESRMRLPRELSDSRHIIAFAGRQPVGFAELRMMPDAVCLNYIALAPARRGRRDADRLLSRALDTACEAHHRTVMLDVFASNAVSGAWYRKLGFEAEGGTAWWSLPLDFHRGSGGGAGPCAADGLPEADACWRAYGFSRFTLSTPRANYRIGWLGTRWFRTDDPGLLEDERAIACLSLLDPSRRLLGLFPTGFEVGQHRGAERLDMSVRMRAGLHTLRVRLKERIGT